MFHGLCILRDNEDETLSIKNILLHVANNVWIDPCFDKSTSSYVTIAWEFRPCTSFQATIRDNPGRTQVGSTEINLISEFDTCALNKWRSDKFWGICKQ